MALADQLEEIGRRLGTRESAQAKELERIKRRAQELHARVQAGLEGFRRGTLEAGAAHLAVTLSDPRIDDKHFHSVQFDLTRGRHRVVITTKSKGEVTLVGPFKAGKQEGPCTSISLDDDDAIDAALVEVLSEFLETAFTP